MTDARQSWPAPERNKAPILAELRRVLPASGTVLEIASGSGQHVVHFAQALRDLHWQPTDREADHLASIDAWSGALSLPNVAPAMHLDVLEPWPIDHADALLNSNLIHIAPWSVTTALLNGAAALLSVGAPMVLYGPYKRQGAHTAPSNESFDESLRARDPSWGVRNLETVVEVAQQAGFALEEVVQMPANNLLCVYRRV